MLKRSPSLVLTALLLAPALAGCLGPGGEDPALQVQQKRAHVDAGLGGVEGVITDEAVQPIEGANVTLVELGETVRTAPDGSFAFSLVEPGSYTLSVEASTFVPTSRDVRVEAAKVAVTDLLLTRLLGNQPYTQAIEFSAFFECGVGVGHDLPNPDLPLWVSGVTWSTCTTVNSITGGNTTNDDFSETLRLDPPVQDMVWEARWDTGSHPMADRLWLVADIEGHAGTFSGNWTVYQNTSIESPFRAVVDQARFEAIAAYFQARCDGSDGHAQDDSFCGYNFWDRGWPLTVRTFTAYDCVPAPASACAPAQLEVTHVITGFYNTPAPENFTVFGGH